MNSEQATPACRRKVHIALVGGQPDPVYNVIKALSPDIVELVFSGETIGVKDSLLKNLSDIKIEGSEVLSATEVSEIEKRAKELVEKYAGDDITINISGGTKSWALIFGLRFYSMDNACVLYIDQNNMLWNLKTMTGQKHDGIHLDTHFRLAGHPLDESVKMSSYDGKDDEVAKYLEKLWREQYEIDKYNNIITQLTNPEFKLKPLGTNPKYPLSGESYIRWNKSQQKKLNTSFIEIFIAGQKESKKFISPHAFDLAFHFGWFEYKVAKLFYEWPESEEVLLNCVFKYPNNQYKNEIDVIVKTKDKLIFVECKTTIKSNIELDKFSRAVEKYGGKAAKAVFITAVDPEENTIKKCEDNNIFLPQAFDENFNKDTFFIKLKEELKKHNV